MIAARDAADIEDLYELSPLQQGILFHCLAEQDPELYVIRISCRLEGSCDVSALARAWQHVASRHPILRTSFHWEGLEKPVQLVHRKLAMPVDQEDWRAGSAADNEERLAQRLETERRRGMPIHEFPLTRVSLVRLADDRVQLLWAFHHILLEGWSAALLLQEVMAAYEAISRGATPVCAPRRPYRDFIEWLQARDPARAEAYWREALRGLAGPTRVLPALSGGDGGSVSLRESQGMTLTRETTAGLQALAREARVTLNTVAQGAWAILLSHYTGEEDVTFGSVVSGRQAELPGIESVVGLLVNTLAARIRVEGSRRLGPWLRALQRRQLGMREFEHSALVDVHRWSPLPADTPLFDALFAFENWQAGVPPGTGQGALEIRDVRVVEGGTGYPLSVEVRPGPALTAVFSYDGRRCDRAAVCRLRGHYQTLLESMARRPEARLDDLELVSPAERKSLLTLGAGDRAARPSEAGLVQLFEARVVRAPDAVAVQCGADRRTYRELNDQANRLARHLVRYGVGPEVRVGICCERSVEMVVGLLGILKAGGAYVPLDPSYPQERLAFMLEDSGVGVVVTQERLLPSLPSRGARFFCLDGDWNAAGQGGDGDLPARAGEKSLAYVIYTSGSTGTPKGVEVEHGGLLNLVHWHRRVYGVTESDRATQLASLSFDASVWEIWPYLAAGASVHLLADEDLRLSPEALLSWMASSGTTVSFLPTPLAEAVLGEAVPAGLALRALLTGGDTLHARPPGGLPFALFNHYGPTEASVVSTWTEVGRGGPGDGAPPIGRPIDNTRAYVLDGRMRLVPVGVPGELYVGGASLARGYLGRPDLTAELFVPDPFASAPGQRLYRTGDRVRWRADGQLEFLGRADRQVKIRGFRVETGEIEAVLAAHPGVKDAVVLARDDGPGQKRLVAYVTERDRRPLDVAAVREHVKAKLPEYMTPTAFVVLDRLPLTANGKVDTRALPAPGQAGLERDGRAVTPRTPIEEGLAEIWSDVLGRDGIGIRDEFFGLGGHSLLATRVMSQVRRSFRVEVPLRALFEAPTIEGLARVIAAARRGGRGDPAPPMRPASEAGDAPLSFAQQRLWFLDQMGAGAAYNIPLAVRVEGPLDREALRRSLSLIVGRHEALRTTFPVVAGRAVQVVGPAQEVDLPETDLGDLPPSAREHEARRLAAEEAQRVFDLARGPLLRARLLRLAPTDHVLLLCIHHIVADGWSMGVVTRELAAHYRATVSGGEAVLPRLPVQYADFARWQRQWLRGEVLDRQLAYWRQRLGGEVPRLELPTDRPRPVVQTYRGAVRSFAFSPGLVEGIQALCRAEGATTSMVLLAGFKALLRRSTGQEDIAVGSPIANRNRSEIEDLIGFFVNTLVLRTSLSGDPSFRELVGRVKETALGAYDHQDLPFEKLVEELHPDRDLSQSPLFQVIFAVQNAPFAAPDLPGLALKPFAQDVTSTRFDLEVHVWEHQGALRATFCYNADLFDSASVDRMGRHWLTLLASAVARPESPIAALPVLGEEERRAVLSLGQGRRAEYPRSGTVQEQFELQAARCPESVAVAFGDERLTYAELNRRANQVAHRLMAAGVEPGSRVAICLDRSLDLPVALLGILKAGGAYVPLDPEYPRERLAFMLEDARPDVLLSQERHLPALARLGTRVLCLDQDAGTIARERTTNPRTPTQADDLAYVTYTSGSTGTPKGVEVTHRGVLRLVLGADYVELGPGETLLQLAPVSFDASTLESWGALLNGGRCVVYPDRVPSPRELGEVLQREGVTTLWLTASLFNVVVDESPEILAPVRQLLIGGEALSVGHVRRGLERLPRTRIVNGYGPTEGTTFTCCHSIPPGLEAGVKSIPIGRPIANTDVFVLDEGGELAPVGVTGELYVGGDGLARGYFDRPELTAERFVPHPFAARPGERLYRTGDRARWRSDGTLDFLGRNDDQVKIRGHRVELGEVEAVLSQHPAVGQAAVLVREGALPNDKRLVAYVVPDAAIQEGAGTEGEREGRVAQWKKVYESVIYDRMDEAAGEDPTFNLSGWNSTYTGLAIPEEEMREQVEQVVDRILAGRPRRVLEIGCGTGLLLARIASHCECYVATDFSTKALEYVRGALPAVSGLRAEVELLERGADDFSGIESGGFDAVVLNSVVQYFPDVDYLRRVMEAAVGALVPGGRLFVGDVRHLPLLETFVASVQACQAPADVSRARLRERVKEHLAQEQELVVDPRFFLAFARANGGIGRVHVTPRRGRARNELTKYRYDALLEVGPAAEEKPLVWLDWEEDELTLLELRRLLAETEPSALGARRVPNARVAADVSGMRWLSAGEGDSPPSEGDGEGVDPEALWGLSAELPYEVDLSWAAAHAEGRYDVLFRRTRRASDRPASAKASPAPASRRELPVFPGVELGERAWAEYANDPLRATQVRALVPEMRRYLQERLPEYMVPSAFVVLQAMPLTPNGKVDARALLATEVAREQMEEVFEGPRTPVEEELSRIWAQVLGLSRVGVRDNFFELGGDSILSIQVIARANQAGLRLTPKQIFQAQTIAELARVVDTSEAMQAEQGPVSGPVPITPIQSWFFEQDLEEAHHFNQAVLLEVRGGISTDLVEKAVVALEAHHDALRLRFERTARGWRQEIAEPGRPTFDRVDLSTVDGGDERSAIERAAAEEQRSLGLGGPLWRVVWLDLGAGRGSRLLVVIHHLAVDGVSWRVLLEDLERACGQLGRGEPIRLPAKTTSFKAWSEALAVYAGSAELKTQLPYWRGVVSEEAKPLPVDGSRDGGTVGEAGVVTAVLDEEETKALLQDVPRPYHTQVTDVLLLALARAFREWTGERSLLLDLEGHGREEVIAGVDLSRTVGWFTSLFPVRVTLSEGEGIGEDLKLVKEQLRAVPERGLGYGVLRYLGDAEGRSLAGHRDPEVSFNYLGRFEKGQAAEGPFALAKEGAGESRSPKARRRYLLEITGRVASGRLSVTWIYGRAHRRETVEALVGRFEQELKGIVAHCLSDGVGGHTPSDFPLAQLDQAALDRVLCGERDVEDVYPLSPMQEGMLFHCLLDPDSPVYFEQLSIEIQGELDPASLARAWQQVVDRHPVLRTRFAWEGLSRPVQVVERRASLEWEERDLRGLGEREAGEALARLLARDRDRGFDLSRPPLTRVLLVRAGEKTHRLIWDFHHLALDGWCLSLVLKEVSAFYEALRLGRRLELPPVRAYRDYIAWLQKQDLEQAERYWRRYLSGVESSTPLPLDQAPGRIHEGSMEMGVHAFPVSGPVTAALKALGRQHRLTLNTIVQGAWALVLGRYAGESDVVFGATVSGRPAGLRGVESMVGLFINTLPLRVHLAPEKSLLTWLEELQAQQVEQRQYEFSPLVKVQGWSDVPPGQPLFESILAFENYPAGSSVGSLGTIGEVEYHSRTHYPIMIIASPGLRLSLRIAYDRHRIHDESIRRVGAYLTEILEAMARDARRALCELPGLPSREHELLVRSNQTERAFASENILDLFEAQAKKTPERVAVVFGKEKATYRELDERSDRLAQALIARGAGPGTLVALYLERSEGLPLAMLGVLKAGAAYVPLDPAQPASRLALMIEDAEVSTLVTQQGLEASWPGGAVETLCLDAPDRWTGGDSRGRPAIHPEDLAYVIYTSGSTGRPKGVQISHRALANALQALAREPGMCEQDVVVALATLSFDIAGLELLLPLLVGARVVIVDRETARDGRRLGRILDGEGVTMMQATPATWRLLLQSGWQGRPSMKALSGGEALSVELARELLAHCASLWNGYGPTEATIYSSTHLVQGQGQTVPLGRPLANMQHHVLDRHLRRVPVGAPGELYIGGVQLARGYWKSAELTAERFVPDPFSSEPGARLYRTGDLVRLRADGNTDFLGRIDHQVKIRGFRIEPGEVESVLDAHPAVAESVVMAREDHPGDTRLVAYVVASPDAPDEGELERRLVPELRSLLRNRLPDYMVPSAFVILEDLPLNANGKVDRRALPAPDVTQRRAGEAFVAPRTPAERVVASVLAQVLGLETVSVFDRFFDLGGHSLLATQAVSRLREAFGLDVPLRMLFEHPTAAGLAERLEEAQRSGRPARAAAPIPAAARAGELPLSFGQERLWVLDQMGAGATYNIAWARRLRGRLDVDALRSGLSAIVRRHEVLRTTFLAPEGRPTQVVGPAVPLTMDETDLSGLPEGERETEARRLASEEAGRPFDLAQGPLIRAALLRLGPSDHVLLLTIHHIVADGWSMGVLTRELAAQYRRAATGQGASPPELPLQYADFALWQREWLQSPELEDQVAYWRERLGGELPRLDLPTDRPRPVRPTSRGGLVSAVVAPEVVQDLQALGRREGATVFMVLLAAFQALLYRYTGERDVLVGTPIANRNRSETEGLIGFFVNTLVLRTDLSGDPSFQELLGRVRSAALGAYAHQDVPFEALLEHLQPERDLHRNPVFEVFFNMLSADQAPLELPGIEASALGSGLETAKFDLTLYAVEQGHAVAVSFNYSRDLFEEATVAAMLEHFLTLLGAAVREPWTRIDRLPLLTAAQRREAEQEAERPRPRNDFVEFERSECERSIGERFAEVVKRHPGRVAVKTASHAWTYDELDRAAERIASSLRETLGEGEERVALLFDQGAPMLAAILGALRAGSTYVPLDASHPPERLARILEDADVRALVTDRENRHVAASLTGRDRLLLEAEAVPPSGFPARPWARVLPDRLAYLLYTSGSTGEPKAVMQSHRNVLGHIRNYTNALHIASHDHLTLLASYAFDAAVMDIFGALLNGATLHPVELRRDGLDGLHRVLHQEGITIYHSTPTVYRALVGSLGVRETFPGVRLVVLGGEEVQPQDLEAFDSHFGAGCVLVNGLGPTESTVALQQFLDRGSKVSGSRVPVGQPVPGMDVWLLDEAGRRSEVYGEIALRGEHVALGYWRQPDRTATAFLPDPDGGARRIYRTGDLGFRRPDGALVFVGRKDRQVKLRGIRIELGEIESALTRHPDVREAVVVRLQDARGEGRLVGYVTTRTPAAAVEDVLAYVAERLPSYMVPAALVTLAALPLTPNGKIDFRSLPEPPAAEAGIGSGEPRTALEEVLVVMFAEVLDRERVGIHDDFFDLGGHSLLATRVASRVRVALDVDLPLRLLFEKPTVAKLAAALADDPARRARLEQSASRLLAVSGMSDQEVERLLAERGSLGQQGEAV